MRSAFPDRSLGPAAAAGTAAIVGLDRDIFPFG